MKITKITEKFYQEQINFLPFNRKYSVRQKLIDSMNSFGFTIPIILIVTHLITGAKKIFVADGQNRLATARYLGIEPTAIILDTEFKTIEELVSFVAGLNSSQTPWTVDNYAQVFAFLGNKHYHKLLEITSNCPYSVSTMASLLHGIRSKISGAVSDRIKNGTFKVNNLENTLYVLKLAAELSKYEKLTSRMLLALAYVAGLKHFDESKFKHYYQKNAKTIKELKLDNYNDIFASWVAVKL